MSSSLEEFDTLVIGAVGDPPDGGNSHIQLGELVVQQSWDSWARAEKKSRLNRIFLFLKFQDFVFIHFSACFTRLLVFKASGIRC